ncbi:FMN-binding protein [Nonomuraea sp. NEAU-A123]|uniref:FMN-binding protein n=1 Tax=Nonomuraea sp. NEAU-A123 TaxID=2839649 RepID=UPI001BE4CEE3|nr:FMN-binding protein [Nonomuraea sp. NEAU-A123]MBT2233061.1 FMN-binding protein [Nonomuraea sp. NEAU-A123]
MKRALLAVVTTVIGLVLLLSFKPHDVTGAAQPPAALAQTQTSATPAPTSAQQSAATKTVDGDAADTRWGPVQVQISVTGGKISSVQVLQAPNENRRDIEINNTALPILQEETMSAQSAQIDSVSGATYTSDGYIQSLQSAIDRAGL